MYDDNAGGRFTACRGGYGAYGGIWVENIVSGIARDILVEAMFRIEAAGYPITMHVHDELVCEVPIGFGSLEEFPDLMTRSRPGRRICRSQPTHGAGRVTANPTNRPSQAQPPHQSNLKRATAPQRYRTIRKSELESEPARAGRQLS